MEPFCVETKENGTEAKYEWMVTFEEQKGVNNAVYKYGTERTD